MKPLLIVLLLTTSLMAQAELTGIRTFQGKNLKIDPAHAENVVAADVTVNYTAKTVTLDLVRNQPCAAGMICIQSVPAPVSIELPITATEMDSCGIVHITASEDQRPVDGALREIKLDDIQNMTCQTLVAVVAHASYRTAAYSRLESQLIEKTSTMDIDPLMLPVPAEMEPPTPAVGDLQFADGSLYRGFLRSEIPQNASLKISKDSVSFEFSTTVKCDPMTVCPKIASKIFMAKLPIVRIKESSCGDRIVALSRSKQASEMIEILDYRSATCKIAVDHVVKAHYQKMQKTSGRKFEFIGGVFRFDRAQ